VGAAGVARQRTIESFCKDLLRTRRRIAEPPTSVHAHPHDLAAPWQIQRVPLVAAVLPPAQLTTPWTRDYDARGFDDKHQTSVALDNDKDDAPAFQLCAKRGGHCDSPRPSR